MSHLIEDGRILVSVSVFCYDITHHASGKLHCTFKRQCEGKNKYKYHQSMIMKIPHGLSDLLGVHG